MKRKLTPRIIPFLALWVCGMALTVQLHAQGITMQFKGSVRQAIELLQKKYNYSVVIKTQGVDLGKQVVVNAANENINSVVSAIFAQQEVDFTIEGHNILVSRKLPPPPTMQGAAPDGNVAAFLLKGRVTDSDGQPIAGAVVQNRTGNTSAITDAKGYYSILASEGSQIEVSILGYEPKTVSVYKQTAIDVTLREAASRLDEVIVVGYGTQRKSDLTGAITQVDMKQQTEATQAITTADYLRGKVAGLNISRSASTQGQSSFTVRGRTSLSATTTTPLLVVDGLIYYGNLNDINPGDIETVTVLKDASSAAVYGAAAAAGVVLITTKQGKSDKPTIRFDMKTSVSSLLHKQEAYDLDGYLQARADRLNGEGATTTAMPGFYTNPYRLPSDVSLSTWMGYTGAGALQDPTEVWLNRLNLYPNEKQNYYNYNTTNWLNKVFRTGVVQDYNLSVSGKSKDLVYYWSLGYLDNKGVVVNDNYNNVRARINLSNTITKFLEVGIRGNLSSANSDGQPADWSTAYNNSPLGDVYNADGTYTWYPNTDIMAKNPLDITQRNVYQRQTNLIGTAYAKVTLPFGFKLQSTFNNRWQFRSNYTYRPSFTIDGSASDGNASREDRRQYDWLLENLLSWNKTFGIHRFDVTLLQSSSKWMQYLTNGSATNFTTSEALGWHALGYGDVTSGSSEDQQDTKASYMGRINYGLMDRYMLTLTIRRDGYSGFGQANPWGNFPGAAVAWRVSKEQFMKSFKWLDDLKLRFSYGKNGNLQIGRYAALGGLANDFYLNQDKQNIVTLYPTTMANKNLQWETTLAANLGLDMSVLHNRITLTAEFYKSKTTDMLMQRGLPTITGYSSVASNLGRVDNKGIEITVNSVNISRHNVRWSSDFTFSLNRNKIVHLYGDYVDVLDADGNVIGQREADDPTNNWYIGHASDAVYGYKRIGIWQLSEAAEAAALGHTPGDYRYYITPGATSYSTADYQWLGYTQPRYRLGLNNTVTLFGNLTVQMMLRAEIGAIKASNEINVGSYADRVSQMKFPYWTPDNPSDYWGKLGAKNIGTIYRSASFLRIENISVSYSLPKKWIKHAAMQNANVFFNMDNVNSFDNWLYWDVETKAPTPTTFTFGLNFTL